MKWKGRLSDKVKEKEKEKEKVKVRVPRPGEARPTRCEYLGREGKADTVGKQA